MTAVERFRACMRLEEVDRPVVFGEYRHPGLIHAMTGKDIRDEDDEDTRIAITGKAYAKAGVSVLRSLMLPRWGLYRGVMWDGYLNWKPDGDRQMGYAEAIEYLRSRAEDTDAERSADAARKARANRDHVQALLGEAIHYMPNVTHRGLEGLYHHIGIENFAYAIADEPGLVGDALEADGVCQMSYMEAMLEGFDGPAVHVCDDLGMKNTTLFSPAWLRKHFFPRLKKLAGLAQSKGVAFTFHTCGNVTGVLDDILGAGAAMIDGWSGRAACA